MTDQRNQIIRDYVPLARKLAKEYTPEGMAADDGDFVSCAYEALVKAASRLDLTRTGYSTFLKKAMEGSLKNHLTAVMSQGLSGISTTKYGRKLMSNKGKLVEVTREEVAEVYGIPEEIADSLIAVCTTAVLSTDAVSKLDGRDETFGDTLCEEGAPSPEELFADEEDEAYKKKEVGDWLAELTPLRRSYVTEVQMHKTSSRTAWQQASNMGWGRFVAWETLLLDKAAQDLYYIKANLEDA